MLRSIPFFVLDYLTYQYEPLWQSEEASAGTGHRRDHPQAEGDAGLAGQEVRTSMPHLQSEFYPSHLLFPPISLRQAFGLDIIMFLCSSCYYYNTSVLLYYYYSSSNTNNVI